MSVVVSVLHTFNSWFVRARHGTWRSSRFGTSWQLRIVPAIHGFASRLLIVLLWARLSQHGWRAARHLVHPATA